MDAAARAHLELSVNTHLQRGQSYCFVQLGSCVDSGHAIRELVSAYTASFTGVDVADGRDVDVLMRKPYRIPVPSNSVDVLILGQLMEQVPFCWALFLEIERVLKPRGFVFLSTPARQRAGESMDPWRHSPDSMRALAAFSRLRLIEAHTDRGTVGVFRKPERPSRLLRAVGPVIVWWANRVGGVDHVPRPALRSGRAKVELDADAGGNTSVFGIEAIEVTFDSSSYFVPAYAQHRPVARQVLSHTKAEHALHELVTRTMKERPGSMVHAGAFFGDMLPNFAAQCPGTVYAFEPVAENYLLARETVEKNELSNVLLVHAGLGDRPQIARVETSDGTQHWGGGSQIVRDDRPQIRTQQVPILSIDQFDIDDLTLIQLDVEGHELFALEGARRTIERHRPAIVVEDFRRNCEEMLTGLGYRSPTKIGARDYLYLPA